MTRPVVEISLVIPFLSGVAFHIETSHLFCSAKKMTGFYVKHNTGQKWLKPYLQPELLSEISLSETFNTLLAGFEIQVLPFLTL